MKVIMQVLHQGGGAGSVTSTLHLSLGLARSGFHVLFVCPPDSEVEALARAGGLEVLPLSLRSGARLGNAGKLASLLDHHPAELVNSQSARDREALTWLALTGRLRTPLVITRRQMPRTFILENWLASRAAVRVVAVSRAVGEALVRRGTQRGKLAVIPNGLVLDRVAAPSATEVDAWQKRIGWSRSHRTLGIVSRLKDQAVVLRALDLVPTPVRLVLAGVDQGTFGPLISRAPPRHEIICIPFTSNVRGLYELLELVLLPSRIEGLSQALLEAMALGKPVIASRAAGNLDLIADHRDGRLVEPLDPGAWARAIEELLHDNAAAGELGRVASQTARETFDLRRTVERTGSLYRAILGGSPLHLP
jgi:glycosyltransferase involved in cell wall biosynthesis